jgi:hypothetical protein
LKCTPVGAPRVHSYRVRVFNRLRAHCARWSIKFYLIACQPALPRLACLNHSVWFVVDVRIIAVSVIISTRLSLANLYTQFARYHSRRYCHLIASPHPQHLSHRLLALPSYPIPRGSARIAASSEIRKGIGRFYPLLNEKVPGAGPPSKASARFARLGSALRASCNLINSEH